MIRGCTPLDIPIPELFLMCGLPLDPLSDIFLQTDPLLNSLSLLFGVVGDSVPSGTLILQAEKVLSFHTADQAFQRGALDCSTIEFLFANKVLISDNVTFFQAE